MSEKNDKELYLNFDEYIRQGEPSQREAAYAWSTAIGLQAVDGLKTSEYLNGLARRNIEGEITIDEVEQLLNSYYENKTTREADDDDKQEADKASKNIKRILSVKTCDFSTNGYISLHRRIFEGVMKHVGKLRKYDITKREWVLEGDTVSYLNWEDLRRAVDYDIQQERDFSYKGISNDELVAHIANFVSGLWQIHAFGEGNTRTTAVFIIQYLRSLGFNVENDLFAKHSWYFRNALVRANYKNAIKGIDYSPVFLERFFRNLLLGEQWDLRNRYLHINPPAEWKEQPNLAVPSKQPTSTPTSLAYTDNKNMEHDTNNIPELQSPFEQLREVDADGKEWWNSRKLARVMGYGKYWNFERVIAKAQAWTSQKGYHLGEHFVEIIEMAELGNGAIREVTSIRLSRAACMAVAMNADQKKDMVKAAQQYFSSIMSPDVAVRSMESSVLMYRGGRGKVQVQVVFDTNTFWLSQQRMAELFGVDVRTVNYHLKQIDESGEIHLSDTIRKIRIPSDKWSGEVMMYNLDTVIAVGYRVNSYEATQFRIWATQVLKEYLTKGFVLDDERLKGKNVFGADYFDDLLDRIREIRISERRYYQKITDIYSECSSDYDKDSEETQLFFKTVQNMMHYAVTKQTAAEIIYDRADAERPHMGLTTWKNAPDGRVVKSDVTVAKNYLSEKEVDSLNRLSNAFIDIAEQRAEDHILMTMADWSALLQRYMDLNNRPLLPDAGRVTHEQAVEKALTEYDKFRVIQDREIMSDFDKQLKLLFGDKKD